MRLIDRPLLLALFALVMMWLAAILGAMLRRRRPAIDDNFLDQLKTILTAVLTVLGLLLGFLFSMAMSRYDLRVSYEAAEANAISTEYLRVELLSPEDLQRAQSLLRHFLDERILFYQTGAQGDLDRIYRDTRHVEDEMWSVVRMPAQLRPTVATGLVAAGMNEVIDLQGYAQAAYWNRIPAAAWLLMLTIGIYSTGLFGYTTQQPEARSMRLLVLPLIVAVVFFLIADIESPRGGAIRMVPRNLLDLSQAMAAQ